MRRQNRKQGWGTLTVTAESIARTPSRFCGTPPNSTVRPGLPDVPNNGIDENCDGRDATFAEPDSDGDAIRDGRDVCPDASEDFDGASDTDGCPEDEQFEVIVLSGPDDKDLGRDVQLTDGRIDVQ